jgi:hypothetical protein
VAICTKHWAAPAELEAEGITTVLHCSTSLLLQELEVGVREGTVAKGQLEEAKRKLGRQKTQLRVMADRHVDTLSRLESTKVGMPNASLKPLQMHHDTHECSHDILASNSDMSSDGTLAWSLKLS